MEPSQQGNPRAYPTPLFVLLFPVGVMLAGSVCLLQPVFLRLLAVLFCPLVLLATVYARSLRTMFVATAVMAVVLSIARSNWPVRAAFAMARPRFDRLAAEVRDGNPPPMPCRVVGLFHIRRAEFKDDRAVCLWTNLDPGGKSGFVLCPDDDVPLNIWSQLPLDGHWQFIAED